MPDNYGKMTSSEAPKELQDFCYPKQQKENRAFGLYGIQHAPKKEKVMENKRFPTGDPECEFNNGEDCWVDENDPDYSCYGIDLCPQGKRRDKPKQEASWGKALFEGIEKPSVPYRGEDMIGDNGFGTTEHALKSARDALWTIANMQITENTEKGEVLDLCMSIARIELEKCYTANK